MNIFIKRIFAFFIDVIIISLVCSVFTTPFVNNTYNEKMLLNLEDVFEEYDQHKFNEKVLLNKTVDIVYDINKKSSIINIINIAIYVLYFIIFQFYNNGQTFGKKLMKIKVVSNNNELTMNDMVMRSFIADSIIFDLLNVLVLLFISRDLYIWCVVSLLLIKNLTLFICVIMMMLKKDGRGIQDLLGNTKVVEV